MEDYGSNIYEYLKDSFLDKPINNALIKNMKDSIISYLTYIAPDKKPPEDMIRLERDTVVINAEKWSEYMWPELQRFERAKKIFEYWYGVEPDNLDADFEFSSNGDLLVRYKKPVDYISITIDTSKP